MILMILMKQIKYLLWNQIIKKLIMIINNKNIFKIIHLSLVKIQEKIVQIINLNLQKIL